jgi:uncharacterized membrane protein YagU involved in acid resistance
MSEYQKLWSKAQEKLSGSHGHANQCRCASSENATEKTAHAISKTVFGKRLSRGEKQRAGRLVHYTFGTLMGGAYGAAAESSPLLRRFAGLPFGTALFVGADEIAVPALKLSEGPSSYPISQHLNGFSSHVVWGATAELVRRAIRRIV